MLNAVFLKLFFFRKTKAYQLEHVNHDNTVNFDFSPDLKKKLHKKYMKICLAAQEMEAFGSLKI